MNWHDFRWWRKAAVPIPPPSAPQEVVHFVGAFFLDKASRLYEQKASAVLVIV
jgi:hypothetical protein